MFWSVVDPDPNVLVVYGFGSECFGRLWIRIRMFWSVVDPDQNVLVGSEFRKSLGPDTD